MSSKSKNDKVHQLELENQALRSENEQTWDRANLTHAQLLMVGSEIANDPKIDPDDRSDPRWTPTLQEVSHMRTELMRLRGALHMLRSHAQAAHDYYIKKAKGECRGMAPVRRTNLFQSMSLSDLKALLREIDYALDNGRKGEGVACTES